MQIKRSPLHSGNKMKKKIKRVKSVNALRERQWDDRFIYDKIPLYDSKNDKNVLIDLRAKCNSGNRKFQNKGINFPDNSLFLYRPLTNKTTIDHIFLNGKKKLKVPSAKSREINFRNDNYLNNKYQSFLEFGQNKSNGFENFNKNENRINNENIDSTNTFNVISLINMNSLMRMWDDLAVNKNYRKLFSVIYKELDDENKEELYKKESNELNKIKDYINDLKKNIENRVNTIQELFDLNVKLNTEIINKDNKCNEIILEQISDKINSLRVHTINVCKSMKQLKTELSGIKNLDKFDIKLIGEKFNFDKNYLIKMKGELNFLKTGFAKYYFNFGNDQTPFLLKASEKNSISNDKDPFIHLVPLSKELKEEITDCTYYIYQELIAYQNEKVHNKVLRCISPLKRINNNNSDDAKNLGDRDDSENKKKLNEHMNNKINLLMNKNTGIKNYINMSEDNINNKFNSLQLQQYNKKNKIIIKQNNNLYFRKYGLINKNKFNEENRDKIMNDFYKRKEENEIIKLKSNSDIKNIKDYTKYNEQKNSKSTSDLININKKDKNKINKKFTKKNSYEYKNLFLKYKINDSSINQNNINKSDKLDKKDNDKDKDSNQNDNLNSQNEKNQNISTKNDKKENEDIKIESDFDDLLS